MMEPLISLGLLNVPNPQRAYPPGGKLEFEYQLDAVEAEEVLAVEASVLWYTEGKGDEDLGVHYFERYEPHDAEDGDLRPLRKRCVELPHSPLSYDGSLLQVRWCVRVRLYLADGKQTSFDQPFRLGWVPAATPIAPPPATDAAADSDAVE
jgi:hypothetical protein